MIVEGSNIAQGCLVASGFDVLLELQRRVTRHEICLADPLEIMFQGPKSVSNEQSIVNNTNPLQVFHRRFICCTPTLRVRPMSIAVPCIRVLLRLRVCFFSHAKRGVLLWYMLSQKRRNRLSCQPRRRRDTNSRINIVSSIAIVLCGRGTIIWVSSIRRHLDRHDGDVRCCMLQEETKGLVCMRVWATR
jgi:hypothetical protein